MPPQSQSSTESMETFGRDTGLQSMLEAQSYVLVLEKEGNSSSSDSNRVDETISKTWKTMRQKARFPPSLLLTWPPLEDTNIFRVRIFRFQTTQLRKFFIGMSSGLSPS